MSALVVGGGPAGAALAVQLARGGRHVVVLEREPGPAGKVCGEFLSREAGFYLAALGVDLAALGAVPIHTVRLWRGRRAASSPLPFAAWSLAREVLDEALLRQAEAAGARVRRGAKVVALAPHADGFRATLEDGEPIDAAAAFLATGKHDLRGFRRPAGWHADLVAFQLHVRLAPAQAAALDGAIELALFGGGYAGLALVGDGRANLCLVVRRARFSALHCRWDALLAAIRRESPALDERLAGAEPCESKPRAIAPIPYGLVRHGSSGVWYLGDQAAVIPSFAGDGISIALHSAARAARAFLGGETADDFQRALARDLRAQVLFATALSHGLVRHASQAVFGAAARVAPRLMAAVAMRTRIPGVIIRTPGRYAAGSLREPGASRRGRS